MKKQITNQDIIKMLDFLCDAKGIKHFPIVDLNFERKEIKFQVNIQLSNNHFFNDDFNIIQKVKKRFDLLIVIYSDFDNVQIDLFR